MRPFEILADFLLPPRESETFVRRIDKHAMLTRLEPVITGGGERAVVSLFPYRDPLVEACILETKFQGNERAAEFLGRALSEFLYEFLAESAAFDPIPPCIVPLPLSPARLKERGYNQVERVIRSALESRPLRAEVDSTLLVRARETLPQTSLSGSARRRNVEGAFVAVSSCSGHRTYIMVDDVITTGHTMLAASTALRAAGAKRLLPLTFAY